LRLTCWVIT